MMRLKTSNPSLPFNRTSLELKLQRLCRTLGIDTDTFNRTSLELKRTTLIDKYAGMLELLIAPVWN